MSTVEIPSAPPSMGELANDLVKMELKSGASASQTPAATKETQQHPLHQFDLTIMAKFYEACVGKFREHQPAWHPTEWTKPTPQAKQPQLPQSNPITLSLKQQVYESFQQLARETGEPMLLLPNFDYGDVFNFVRFLQNLKADGINAVGKFKNYLNNKDMRKFEVDLVVLHPRWGVLLVEVKDGDHLDAKRRVRAKTQLTSARACFEAISKLLVEAKGWTHQEASIPITEFIALPNVLERPQPPHPHTPATASAPLQTPGGNHNHSASSNTSQSERRHASRQLHYLVRADLSNANEFAKWWTREVVEPKTQHAQTLEADGKPANKFEPSLLNWMSGLISCIRSNSVLPVVYPETGAEFSEMSVQPPPTPTPAPESTPAPAEESADKKPSEEKLQFQPALNVFAEFFPRAHEQVRAASRVLVAAPADADQARRALCLQTLWLLLNDPHKKISVVCSESNKPFYEAFFARQRKLYTNLNNLRLYVDLQSCAVNAQSHTLKKDAECWIFDAGVRAPGGLAELLERAAGLHAFWIFSTEDEAAIGKHQSAMDALNMRQVRLDAAPAAATPSSSIKLPMRLQCDLLIIGDLVGTNQVNTLYRYLKTNQISTHSQHAHGFGNSNNNNQQQQQHLSFNPAKKFKMIKFIRGGTIDNLRNALKMHDSVQAPCVLLHVGDEDLFKTRNSVTALERIKELATLVREYCPKSFVVLSTLMRRMSRTENGVISEVNKGIVSFCKQTREQANFYHMLNAHFEPDQHTQEGRFLNNKGLRLYNDNFLFMVDTFLVKNHKQH